MKFDLKSSTSFLMVGKTQESSEAGEGFKRYQGIGTVKVLAVNPSKTELEHILGREIANAPEYVIERDDTKGVCVDILVQTDPKAAENNGIDVITHARFNLFPTLAYNTEKTKVRVVDNYGNSVWANVEDAKMGKHLTNANGSPAWIDTNYRMSFVGEAALLDFLRKFLYNENPYEVVNGTFKIKDKAPTNLIIGFEDPKKLFSGDVSEIRKLVALQPNNKIKMLFGVRTTEEGKQYQTVCTDYDMMARNNNTNYSRIEKNLASAKAGGMYANIDYKVQALQEYSVEPTNLEKPVEAASDNTMPWD